eukprot:m.34110 g.34110  ORF g.34110 m.34110 type:complete len:296 (+) comp7282_c0_seq2:1778-2665(+)
MCTSRGRIGLNPFEIKSCKVFQSRYKNRRMSGTPAPPDVTRKPDAADSVKESSAMDVDVQNPSFSGAPAKADTPTHAKADASHEGDEDPEVQPLSSDENMEDQSPADTNSNEETITFLKPGGKNVECKERFDEIVEACPRDESGALLIPQIKGNADLYAQGSKTFVILAGLHGVHPTYQALKVASHATGSIYPMDSRNDGLAVLTMPARVDVEFEGESSQEVLALALIMAPRCSSTKLGVRVSVICQKLNCKNESVMVVTLARLRPPHDNPNAGLSRAQIDQLWTRCRPRTLRWK